MSIVFPDLVLSSAMPLFYCFPVMPMLAAIFAVLFWLERLIGIDLSAWMASRAIFPDFSSSVTMATSPIRTLSPGRKSIFSKSAAPFGYSTMVQSSASISV